MFSKTICFLSLSLEKLNIYSHQKIKKKNSSNHLFSHFLVEKLLSRNFYLISVKVNLNNFHTVCLILQLWAWRHFSIRCVGAKRKKRRICDMVALGNVQNVRKKLHFLQYHFIIVFLSCYSKIEPLLSNDHLKVLQSEDQDLGRYRGSDLNRPFQKLY